MPLAYEIRNLMCARLGALVVILIAMLVFGKATMPQEASAPEKSTLLSPVSANTELYPPGADAKREIAGAVTRAAAERKRVLLVFGANWCYDCHVLNRALHEGAAGNLVARHFVVVHVDIG